MQVVGNICILIKISLNLFAEVQPLNSDNGLMLPEPMLTKIYNAMTWPNFNPSMDK